MSILARYIKKRSVDPWPTLSLNDYMQMVNYGGVQYAPSPQMTLGSKTEDIAMNFQGVVQGALKSNGIVWACLVARAQLFSEAVFKFQRLSAGRPGDMFGTPALTPLERPWVKATTADLISRMSLDADLAGEAFLTLGPPSPIDPTRSPTIRRLRPDWVTIIGGSKLGLTQDSPMWQWDVEPIGYLYHPGGIGRTKPQSIPVEKMAHFTPWGLDPELALRGMTPLSSIVGDITADQAMNTHKRMFLENGATPNLVVTLPEAVTPDKFNDWVEAFDEEHEGVINAYKTIYFGGGATTQVVGADLRQLDFKVTQGHGETRICSALRVEPIIVGVSEGLETATYSNYGQALRAMSDLTARPWWRNAAGSLSPLVVKPPGTRLWYDDRDIAFLREDGKDVADIQVKNATAIELLVRAGYEPESIVKAVSGNDMTLLVHSGLASVQLQPLAEMANPAKPEALPAAKPPAGESVPPKPAPKAAAKAKEFVPYRDSTDPLRMLVWVAARFDRGWQVECARCMTYTPVERHYARCAGCGTLWHAQHTDNERGAALLEEYAERGHEFRYPPTPPIGGIVPAMSNGHGELPATLPPAPPPT
jgi:hypothetical protein